MVSTSCANEVLLRSGPRPWRDPQVSRSSRTLWICVPKGWDDFTDGQGRSLLGEGTISIERGEVSLKTCLRAHLGNVTTTPW